MNSRVTIAALYSVAFGLAILSASDGNIVSLFYSSLIMAFLGLSISLCVYKDGASIEDLKKRIRALEREVHEEGRSV